MFTRLALAAAVSFTALNAQAADLSRLEPAFGNTIVITYPDSGIQRIWMERDGTWTAVGRRGTSSSGRWTLRGEKVCFRRVRPFPVPISYCARFPDHGATGVSWTAKDMKGEPIRLTVVEGMAAGRAPAGE